MRSRLENWWQKITAERTADRSAVEMKLLPHSVHMALKTRDATLQWHEILWLLTDADWAPYGMSLAIKYLQAQPQLRDQLLTQYVDHLVDNTDPDVFLKQIRPDANLGDQASVTAAKLYQVNRYGPRTFRELFEAHISTLAHRPAIIAHTSLVALPYLCQKQAQPFVILYPQQCHENPASNQVLGHVIVPNNPTGERVRVVGHADDVQSLLATDRITLVDDTSATGQTFKHVSSVIGTTTSWPKIVDCQPMIRA